MCAVNAEYFFLCVFCLCLSRVWEPGQSHSASVSASPSTSLKHLMLTKGSCLPSLERDSWMKRTLSMSGAVRIKKLTDVIKSAKSALRATQWKGLWIEMQAIIFSFMPVGWGITFPFAPKAFISAVLSLYFPLHHEKYIYRVSFGACCFLSFLITAPQQQGANLF